MSKVGWTVLGEAGFDKGRRRQYAVRCNGCGMEKAVDAWSIKNGKSRGCLKCNAAKTHGMSSTREYKSWECMISRCTLPTYPYWADYGGRGITVCERWRKFDAFYEDMGPRPDKTSLDRIDNSGNYEPGNVRWATIATQSRNRRNTKVLDWEVEQVVWLCTDGGYSQSAVARAFNTYSSNVNSIVRGGRRGAHQ